MGPRVATFSLSKLPYAWFIALGMNVSSEYKYNMVTTNWLYGFPVSNFESIGAFMSPLLSGLSFKYKLNASFLCYRTSYFASSFRHYS